jgi:hypothetical protein
LDLDCDVIVETDASDYVSTGVLSQYDDGGILHPVTFFSKKHSPAECNYEIYDKELMAIVHTFKEWRPELQSIINHIHVLSDYKNLEYFTTMKLLNQCQAQWSQFLWQFNFKIVYCPGTAWGKTDALTRRSRDLPNEGDDHSLENQTTIIMPENILHASTATPSNQLDIPLVLDAPILNWLFHKAYATDLFPNKVLQILRDDRKQCKDITLAECEERNNLLLYWW